VHWMGWRPTRVTYTSDYFDQLHALAVELIKRGKAFVCHQTKADMEKSKDHARHKTGNPNSPWRDRSVEENLFEFENMRLGLYEKGAATLRMKIDMNDPRPCMWDPVAYRIKYHHHPRTGDKWCIYPSYDFSHCLVDSIEHIDYSLCTLEFEARRDSYYWLLEALDLWRPHVYEFSRLNITCNPLSKRKLLTLVTSKTVSGWDDPRICTINGLRRRGYTPEAINNFCRDIGVTRTENVIQLARLEHFVRQDLNAVRV
jgi:glutaminyl-tRNA synthetase